MIFKKKWGFMFSFLAPNVHDVFSKRYEKIKELHFGNFSKFESKELSDLTGKQIISIAYISCWSELSRLLKDTSLFEKRTPFNRETVGEYLLDEDVFLSDPRYHLFISLRFIWEFYLAPGDGSFPISKRCLDPDFVHLLDDIPTSEWGVESYFTSSFLWVKNFMPFEIYRAFLVDPNLLSAKELVVNIETKRKALEDQIGLVMDSATESIEYLDNIRQEAKDLESRLTNVKREGNFKLLAKAFSTLRQTKKKETTMAQVRMWVFIAVLISLPLSLFCYFFNKDVGITWVSSLKYLPLISLEVLFFYFMRLFYIEVKSLKSQLTQIDLRLNLCEFIYDYVETRNRTNSTSVQDSWKAFESLIFSPIQPNEDKIPSVMDGTDVLADLAGRILNAKK